MQNNFIWEDFSFFVYNNSCFWIIIFIFFRFLFSQKSTSCKIRENRLFWFFFFRVFSTTRSLWIKNKPLIDRVRVDDRLDGGRGLFDRSLVRECPVGWICFRISTLIGCTRVLFCSFSIENIFSLKITRIIWVDWIRSSSLNFFGNFLSLFWIFSQRYRPVKSDTTTGCSCVRWRLFSMWIWFSLRRRNFPPFSNNKSSQSILISSHMKRTSFQWPDLSQ